MAKRSTVDTADLPPAKNVAGARSRQRKLQRIEAAKLARKMPRPLDWGQHGDAMRALSSDRHREFAYYLVTLPPGQGRLVTAHRLAGFGLDPGKNKYAERAAWVMAHDERVLAATSELSRKMVSAAHPEIAHAYLGLVRNPDHRDHGRAVMGGLDRFYPLETHHSIDVTHKIVNQDQEALEELRALRQLGVSREKMIETFGGNGLARIERLEAAELAKRAEAAKVIDGEVIEVGANG